MSELISRQAAIDLINRLDIPEDMCVFEILSHIALAIGTLPSAQPEIIRCKDCKYSKPKKTTNLNSHCVRHNRAVMDDDYCSKAERKEE